MLFIYTVAYIKTLAIFSSIQRKRPFNIHGSTIECHSDDGYEVTGDIAPPLHLTTTFLSEAPESYGQVYSRMHNITRRRVEAVLGAVQGGDAITYSSGLSAVQAIIHAIKPRRIYLNCRIPRCHRCIQVME
jgi:cystathionine beta-lyase/cystathionine gamma-synthase